MLLELTSQMPTTELMPLLTKTGTRFVYLKKKVPALTYTRAGQRPGRTRASTGSSGRTTRSGPIPTCTVGGSVVGFVGADGKGLAGLEYSLNAQLAGVEGKQTFESAPNGSKIPLGDSSLTPARNGRELPAQPRLRGPVGGRSAGSPTRSRRTEADSGFAVVMDVKTGAGPGPGPGARPMDSARPAGRRPGGPRQPGHLRSVRAGQRAEDPDLRGADRLRHRDAGHQGAGARTGSRSGGTLDQGPLRTTTSCATTCAA